MFNRVCLCVRKRKESESVGEEDLPHPDYVTVLTLHPLSSVTTERTHRQVLSADLQCLRDKKPTLTKGAKG